MKHSSAAILLNLNDRFRLDLMSTIAGIGPFVDPSEEPHYYCGIAVCNVLDGHMQNTSANEGSLPRWSKIE